MRLLNPSEKRIVQLLVEQSTNNIAYLPINVFDDLFNGQDVGFDSTNMDLVFPLNSDSKNSDSFLDIYNGILERALLINYLENEGLVYIVPLGSTQNNIRSIGNVNHFNRVSMHIDESVGNILLKCMNNTLYVSESLRNYVNNEFRSLEEQALDEAKEQTIEAKHQSKLSLLAVFFAILSIILGLFQNCNSIKSNSSIILDTTNIEKSLNVIIENSSQLISIFNDTLVTKIVCSCPEQSKSKPKPKVDPCIKYIRINTCTDTIIPKSLIPHSVLDSI